MTLQSSYYPNYFSIEDVLATQERVPCKFEKPVRGLGYLDPTTENEDIEIGVNMELPYWLAASLGSQRQRIVAVDIPKIYKEAYREIMKADSSVVALPKLGLFYYEFGLYLTRLSLRDSAAITSLLTQTFKDRFRQVFDWAQNSRTDPALSSRLDCMEKRLFCIGQHGRALIDSWLTVGVGQIVASDMVVSHKKRKLVQQNIS